MNAFRIPRSAFLLLGPTGAGKTPLGDEIERCGLWGRRCCHLDFGERLRAVDAAGEGTFGLSGEEVAVVRTALRGGALLENEHFGIAEKILAAFRDDRGMGPDDLLLLNGLPRHVNQAADVDRCVNVRMVLSLDCPPDVVHTRIETNAGGDRSGRADDSLDEVRRKLELFAARTMPILDYYRAKRVRIESVEVTPRMTHQDAFRAVAVLVPIQ